MLNFIAIVLLSLEPAAHASEKARCDYRIRFPNDRPGHLFVSASFQGLPPQAKLQVSRGHGAFEKLDLIKNLQIEKEGIWQPVSLSASGELEIPSASGGKAALRYDLELSNIRVEKKSGEDVSRIPGSDLLLSVRDDRAIFAPFLTLLSPGEGCVATGEIVTPKGWGVTTPWGTNGFSGDYEAIEQSPLVIFKGTPVRQAVNIGGLHASLIYLGEDKPSVKALFSKASGILKTAVGFFGNYTGEIHYLVVFVPWGQSSTSGESFKNGFISYISKDAFSKPGAWGDDRSLHVIAHEFFHSWPTRQFQPTNDSPDRPGRNRWLVEGFTDFFARVILLKSGLYRPKDFLAEFIKQDFSQLKGMSLLDASLNFYQDPEIASLSYGGGAMVALHLNHLLKEKGKSLLEWMQYLNNTRKWNGTATYEEILKALEEYAPGTAAKLSSWLESPNAVPGPNQVYESFGAREVSSPKYSLGAYPNDLKDRLCLVELLENAKDQGLEPGDCILKVSGQPYRSMDQIYAFKEKPVEFTLERKGKLLVKKFKLKKTMQKEWDLPSEKAFGSYWSKL